MPQFFLRLYVAAQTRRSAVREEGFVTAEHLAIAVVGVVLVGVAYVAFRSQITDFIDGIFSSDRLEGQL